MRIKLPTPIRYAAEVANLSVLAAATARAEMAGTSGMLDRAQVGLNAFRRDIQVPFGPIALYRYKERPPAEVTLASGRTLRIEGKLHEGPKWEMYQRVRQAQSGLGQIIYLEEGGPNQHDRQQVIAGMEEVNMPVPEVLQLENGLEDTLLFDLLTYMRFICEETDTSDVLASIMSTYFNADHQTAIMQILLDISLSRSVDSEVKELSGKFFRKLSANDKRAIRSLLPMIMSHSDRAWQQLVFYLTLDLIRYACESCSYDETTKQTLEEFYKEIVAPTDSNKAFELLDMISTSGREAQWLEEIIRVDVHQQRKLRTPIVVGVGALHQEGLAKLARKRMTAVNGN